MSAEPSLYVLRQARVAQSFQERRECYDQFWMARRDLEVALSVKAGDMRSGGPTTTTRFARVSELKRRCRQVDAACADALVVFSHEVIARARAAGC